VIDPRREFDREEETSMSATRLIANFVTQAEPGSLGAGARARVKEHLKDSLGVALAASVEPSAIIVGDVLSSMAVQTGGCYVIANGRRSSPWDAAWANGTLVHLLDFDDYGYGHPTACILPAALAAGELADGSGEEFMLAMAIGWEVFERISRSCRRHERSMRQRGVHPTAVYGPPAAAAAAGRLLGLDSEQLAVAIGLAASGSGGFTEQFGTPGKGVQAGNAARAGMLSAIMASQGFGGTATALEGERGLLSVFAGHENIDPGALTDGLGDGWAVEILGWGLKPYPACGGALRAIDAAIELRRTLVDDVASIDRIEVTATESLLFSLHIDRPRRGFEGKFSLRFCLAVALADGAVTIASFSDESLSRPIIQHLMDVVRIDVQPGGGHGPALFRTPTTVVMTDGRSATADVEWPRGHASNRMDDAEISDKFRALASMVGTPHEVSRLATAIDDLDSGSVRDLVEALASTGSEARSATSRPSRSR